MECEVNVTKNHNSFKRNSVDRIIYHVKMLIERFVRAVRRKKKRADKNDRRHYTDSKP